MHKAAGSALLLRNCSLNSSTFSRDREIKHIFFTLRGSAWTFYYPGKESYPSRPCVCTVLQSKERADSNDLKARLSQGAAPV